MSFRFLHLADLHLDTCFGGLPATRDRLRVATLEAFDRAMTYAEEERLHAVLVAGDLFDDSILSPRVQWRIVDRVRQLTESGCWFLYCTGNHDPGRGNYKAARLGLESGAQTEDWQQRVRVFLSRTPQRVTVADSNGTPVAVVIGAGHQTASDGLNLCSQFPSLAELGHAARDLPVVGLLHTQVEAARSADAHGRYAPSHATDYEQRPYSYWALGHVHLRQRAVPGLPVWYAGNLQGRNPKETGAKGGLVVEARTGAHAEPDFQSFAPVRWERLELTDLRNVETLDSLKARIEAAVADLETQAGDLAVRVVLAGPCPLASQLGDVEELAEVAEDFASRMGLLELQLRTRGLHAPLPMEELRASTTVAAAALDLIQSAKNDPELLGRLAPSELAFDAGEDSSKLAYLGSLLQELEGELLERLAEPEGEQ